MKMSEVNLLTTAEYLKIDPLDLTKPEKIELDAIIKAAKNYVSEYIGKSLEECEKHEELAIATLILCQDMYDNRTRYVSSAAAMPSKTLETLLSLHDFNLL